MPEPTTTKKKKGFFQKLAQLVKDLVEWVEETFSDAELSAEIRDDLGLDRDNPATPAPPDSARKARIEAFAAKEDIDEASLLAVVADIKAEVERDHRLHRGGEGRPGRRPGAVRHAVQGCSRSTCCGCATRPPTPSCGSPASPSTTRSSCSSSTPRAQQLVRGEGPAVDGEAWVQRLSMLGGVTLVVLAAVTRPPRRGDRRRLRLGSRPRGRRARRRRSRPAPSR
jgi:hypothetical protein